VTEPVGDVNATTVIMEIQIRDVQRYPVVELNVEPMLTVIEL